MSSRRIANNSTGLNCFNTTTKQQPLLFQYLQQLKSKHRLKVRVDEPDDALYGVDLDNCTCANTAQTMAKAVTGRSVPPILLSQVDVAAVVGGVVHQGVLCLAGGVQHVEDLANYGSHLVDHQSHIVGGDGMDDDPDMAHADEDMDDK